MFSQSKFAEQKISPRSSIHDTSNGLVKSFAQPKITSTPMRRDSIFATPPKPRLLSNHRYSLSDIATPPRTNRKDFKKSSMYQNSTGPLLASMQFNVNVSTYEDAKSPGLASRIVQYNEEAEREKEYKRPPTHQTKYGSPGLFPVVHLFKKKLPILEQKPRKVSVRLASPDHSRFQSQEYNRKLLEGIIRPGTLSLGGRPLVQPSSESSSSTRSVLDALKEISRKRIHANEEYDLIEENGKRLRTEQINGDTNKRLRDDSPLLETSTSPGKQVSKRVCVYDEYKASCSSSDFSLPNPQSGSKRKSISISTSTENPKESKLVKLINAETQTIIDESHISIDIQDKPGQIETPQSEIVSEEEVKQILNRESPLKIFDDAPLERIRKNRLAALMGSLVGKDAVALTPKPDIATVLTEKLHPTENTLPETTKLIEKPLVSILTRNKSPQKTDKHVHFSIPETASQMTESSNISTAVVTTAPTTLGSASLISTSLETPTPPSSPMNLLPTTAVTSVSQVIFGSNTSLSSTTNQSKDITLHADTPISSAALVNFTIPVTKSMSTTALSGSSFGTTSMGFTMPTIPKPLTSTSSPPKTGGFKFDLNKPVATATPATTTVTSSTFSFGNIAATTVSNPVFGENSVTSTLSSQPMKAVDFSIGSKTSTPSVIGISAVTTTPASFSTPIPIISASPSFSFGANTSDVTTKVGFGNPATQKTFGTPTNQNSFSVSTTKDNFGTPTTQSSFGTPVTQGSFATPTTQISFATPLTQSSFSTPTTQSSFATPTTQSSFATPTTQSSFATPTTQSSFPISTMQTNFGSPAVTTSTPQFATVTSTTAGFGQSKPVFSFGSSANTDKPNLVVQPNPAPFSFGASTTAAITNNTSTGLGTVTTASGFGTATMPSSFGASGTAGGFGTNMSSSGFGKPTSTGSFPTAMNSGGFGVSNKPGGGLFGGSTTPNLGASTTTTTATSGFGSAAISTTSPFGSTNPPGFGASTTQSPFGTAPITASFRVANTFGNTTTTNAPSLFVAKSNTNAFGTNTGGFGNQQPATTNIFGGTTVTQTSSFGAPSSNSVFGTTAPPPFGSSVTTTPTVGFGSNATPAFTFGAKTSNNVFGTSNTFGVTTTNSGFGTTATPSFGSANSFGSSTTSFPANSNFGGANASSFAPATTTQVASYGTTNTPSFGAASVGSFGASSKPIFGNSTTPGFEANPTNPAFVAAASSPGFGATNNSLSFGSNSNRSAFAKPQPTANSFGSTPNTFGANNNFGASQQQGQANAGFNSAVSTTHANVFNFAAAAAQPTAAKPTGVFSFGASASGDTPKPSFNFTGGNTAPPAFGSGAPSFPNTVAPTFGVTGTPQFGAPQPVTAGVFNIGAGPPTAGRARTQLKAKRRT